MTFVSVQRSKQKIFMEILLKKISCSFFLCCLLRLFPWKVFKNYHKCFVEKRHFSKRCVLILIILFRWRFVALNYVVWLICLSKVYLYLYIWNVGYLQVKYMCMKYKEVIHVRGARHVFIFSLLIYSVGLYIRLVHNFMPLFTMMTTARTARPYEPNQ